MEDIEILVFALGMEAQSKDKEFLERCSKLELFEFIKKSLSTALGLMSKPYLINSLGITSSLFDKLLILNPDTPRNKFDCEVCGKTFSGSYKLKRHMNVHTGTKEFECEICKKQFSQLYSLKRHMKLHQDTSPYHCSFCGFSCVQRGHFNDHIKKKHPNTLSQDLQT